MSPDPRGGGEGPAQPAGPLGDAPFAEEADAFVRVMARLAPSLTLDYRPGSLGDLEEVLAASFDVPGAEPAPPVLVMGVGCYLGEVLRRTLGGRWNDEGHLEAVGPVVEAFPLQRARKRLEQGTAPSLVAYYDDVARAAGARP